MNMYAQNARIFKAFCDESRLKIIEQLQKGETCACELLNELPISQSTLSHHMKILKDSGIVTARKNGKWVYYTLSEEGMKQAAKLLQTILGYNEEVSASCTVYVNDKEKERTNEDYCNWSSCSRNIGSSKSKKKQ